MYADSRAQSKTTDCIHGIILRRVLRLAEATFDARSGLAQDERLFLKVHCI